MAGEGGVRGRWGARCLKNVSIAAATLGFVVAVVYPLELQ